MLDSPRFTQTPERVPLVAEVPDGEDIVRVVWKGVRFALVPRFDNGVSGHDDAMTEIRMHKNNPSSVDRDEIFEHMSFVLEVPAANAYGEPTGVLTDSDHAFVQLNIDTLRVCVDAASTDADLDAIVATAKDAYLEALVARVGAKL